ncbi:MAG: hypothetical protein U5L96_08205 [Owenweeksia sp.]|nr:hypothetical protein [Owenweeksia sp.]
MNNKYFFVILTSLFCWSVSAQQLLIDEDFSTPTDSVNLTGWTNNDMNTSNGLHLWWFGYNPRNYDVNSPMSTPAAIFDQQEYLFDAVFMDVALESPTFDASGPGTLTLTFDHYFRSGGFGSSYAVEVYNGSTWDTVVTADTSTAPNPPTGTYVTTSESFNITALTGGSTNAQVRFRYIAPVFTGVYWIVDNVQVQQAGCPPPSALGPAISPPLRLIFRGQREERQILTLNMVPVVSARGQGPALW